MNEPVNFLMPTVEAAKLCGVSARTWRTWDQLGKIPKPIHIGRKLFWRRDEIMAWIEAECPKRNIWIFRR